MFGDEASFWLDGSLHRTWSRVGVQPRVDTFGARKTAHVFGVVTLEPRPIFLWRFAPVFNARTFLAFLKELVRRCRRRKLFLIIDNGPCHKAVAARRWRVIQRLDATGQQWLRTNAARIQLHRLPPYSPEFNPIEGVWKATKRRTTHNRFFRTTTERDAALVSTFRAFQADPCMIAGHTARFL
jgi:transposase